MPIVKDEVSVTQLRRSRNVGAAQGIVDGAATLKEIGGLARVCCGAPRGVC
jgi:hypothetical protein